MYNSNVSVCVNELILSFLPFILCLYIIDKIGPWLVRTRLNILPTDKKTYKMNNIGCLSIHGTHVTPNNSTNNNVVFFLVSDLKIIYYNNY